MAGDDTVWDKGANDAVELFGRVGPRKEMELPISVCAGESEDTANLFAARFGLAVEKRPNPKRFISHLWFHGANYTRRTESLLQAIRIYGCYCFANIVNLI